MRFSRSSLALLGSVACIVLLFASAAVWARVDRLERLGVTFSPVFARSLGEDPVEVFDALVDDLGVRAVRLPVYWNEVAPSSASYEWSLYDTLIQRADDRRVALTLVVGMKSPRWPECHVPSWTSATDAVFDEQERAYIQTVVERYRDRVSVERWQVENEPLFPFGECPPPSAERLRDRVVLVRSLATQPIQVTVSGELEPWSHGNVADVIGVSLYRTTWNSWYGYFRYPFPAVLYRVRSLVQSRPVIISELQAEPWFFEDRALRDDAAWEQAFTREDFLDQVHFARQVGVSEAYLWGVEWWYYLREAGYPSLWDTAREVISSVSTSD